MAYKKPWKLSEVAVRMGYPTRQTAVLAGYLDRDNDRRIEAELSVAEMVELRDDLNRWIAKYS